MPGVGTELRVLTWNMGMAQPSSYGARHDDAWRYALGRHADVALLQECVPPGWLPPRDLVFARKYPRSAWGTAVVSTRLRPSAVEPDPAAQRWLTAMPGTAVLADVSLDGGDAPSCASSASTRARSRRSRGSPRTRT